MQEVDDKNSLNNNSDNKLENSNQETNLESFNDQGAEKVISSEPKSLETLYDVPVTVEAVLGQVSMPIGNVLKLSKGSIVQLDKKVGDPIEIYVNNRLVAKGEIMMVNEHIGVSLTDIIKKVGD
jgi:flagellar motor switch protein FliN